MQPGQVIPSSLQRPVRWLRIAAAREVFGIDLRTLALFRVGLAVLLLADLALRARDLSAHYTDAGILPRAEALNVLSSGAFSLHLLNGTLWFRAGLISPPHVR